MKIKDGFRGERYLVIPGFVTDMMKRDSLLSSLHITDIGYYPAASCHYCERKEGIEQYVLIYCVAGCGFYHCCGRKWTICAGQYFIIPSGEPHVYGADPADPWTIYWIHFGGSLASCYVHEDGGPYDVETSSKSRIRNRQAIFEEIYGVLDSGMTLENLRYANSLFHHYLGSLRYIRQYRAAGNNKSSGDVVDMVIHYLSENIERHLSLNEIACSCGMSESRMSALFRKRTGHSVLNYFNLLKIKQACDYLDNTDLKINQICYKIGVDDPYYFSRLFTKIMGVSPRSFRYRQRT